MDMLSITRLAVDNLAHDLARAGAGFDLAYARALRGDLDGVRQSLQVWTASVKLPQTPSLLENAKAFLGRVDEIKVLEALAAKERE